MSRLVANPLGGVIDSVRRSLRFIDYTDDIVIEGGAFSIYQPVAVGIGAAYGVLLTTSDLSAGEDGAAVRFTFTGTESSVISLSTGYSATPSSVLPQLNRNRDSGIGDSGVVVQEIGAPSGTPTTIIHTVLPALETFSEAVQLAPSTEYFFYIENGSAAAMSGDLALLLYRFRKGEIEYRAV